MLPTAQVQQVSNFLICYAVYLIVLAGPPNGTSKIRSTLLGELNQVQPNETTPVSTINQYANAATYVRATIVGSQAQQQRLEQSKRHAHDNVAANALKRPNVTVVKRLARYQRQSICSLATSMRIWRLYLRHPLVIYLTITSTDYSRHRSRQHHSTYTVSAQRLEFLLKFSVSNLHTALCARIDVERSYVAGILHLLSSISLQVRTGFFCFFQSHFLIRFLVVRWRQSFARFGAACYRYRSTCTHTLETSIYIFLYMHFYFIYCYCLIRRQLVTNRCHL